jgi:DNA-binding transcriptional MerR regulator
MRLQKQAQQFAVPAKLYRIGEVVRYTPFSRQTIHNYTIMGLIQESEWTQGGHRLYDEAVFARLSRILELRKTMTLTQVRKILSEEDDASISDIAADEKSRARSDAENQSHFKTN